MQISLVKNSFYFTYIFLITTGTICFIEALRNPDPKVRHIMNLETCISLVAGYFYGLFVAKIDKSEKEKNEEMPLEEINDNRYTDWAISTPLMLLVLCLVLGMENKHVVNFWVFMLILLFNFLMLGAGYIGEVGTLTKTSANMLGFVFFTLMYGTIWSVYMRNKKTINSQVIFWLFVVLWAFYGVFYQTDTLTKIFGYNILDLLSKAFVGIFFWLYLTKSVKF
jgi:bacteriorhodopsin